MPARSPAALSYTDHPGAPRRLTRWTWSLRAYCRARCCRGGRIAVPDLPSRAAVLRWMAARRSPADRRCPTCHRPIALRPEAIYAQPPPGPEWDAHLAQVALHTARLTAPTTRRVEQCPLTLRWRGYAPTGDPAGEWGPTTLPFEDLVWWHGPPKELSEIPL